MASSNAEQYWATLKDPSEFGQELKRVIEDGDKTPIAQTVLDEQRNAYLQLFSISLQGGPSSSRIMRDGQEGELATFRVPLASALASAVSNLITNQKITWQATAPRADADSRAQTILGNQAVEYYWHDKGGESSAKELADEGVPFGEAFLFVEFDPMAGEITNVEADEQGNSRPVYEGDARFHNVSSWNVKRDAHASSFKNSDWLAVCLRRNKWDLVARYGPEVLEACSELSKGILARSDVSEQTDLVDCWYWFHKRTPALPLGGQAVLIGDRVFARDRLRYRRIPVVRFMTGNLTGTPFPFAPFWTALAAQELQDSILSSIATNNLAFGTQMVGVTQGTEFEPSSFGPMQMVTVPVGGMEPKAIQLTQSPPEAFKLYDTVKVDQRQLLGLNGTSLGQPEGANLSGAAMTMLHTMSIQANSSPQANWAAAVKEAGNILLEIFQDFFTTERQIRIAGKAMGYMAREAAFKGEAIKDVNNVSVRIGNPLSQTPLGREQIFDKFMKLQAASGGTIQIIKTPEDAQQLLETGRLEGLTDSARDQALLVEAENEALARGEPVAAMLGDDDVYHCKHHRSVLTSIEARQDDGLMSNCLEHIWGHYQNAFGTDPAVDSVQTPDLYRLNMMTLMGVVVPQPAMPPEPPGMGAPPGEVSAPPPDGMPEAPDLPTNPMTGQEFDPEAGAAPPGA